MNRLPCFSAADVEAVSRIIGDTADGLTGTEIGSALAQVRVPDVDPGNTKWKRIFNAIASVQNKHQVGNHLIMLINEVMKPVRYTGRHEVFTDRRDRLNIVLMFAGYYVRDDGQVGHTSKATTLSEAEARAGRLKQHLLMRKAHDQVFRYAAAELLHENFFHAVLETVKGIAERIRQLSGMDIDGADLVTRAFSTKNPVLKINTLSTETERNEQVGLSNMIIGLFGAMRNPTAHTPKILWPLQEQDALDIMSLASFIHRKLDVAVKV